MAEDKGSDLDVFEGLTKKKKPASSGALPTPAATMRGGMVPPPKKQSSSSLPLPKPPPKKKGGSSAPAPPPVSLPKPSLPKPKLPKPKLPPPSKAKPAAAVPPPPPMSEAPQIEVSEPGPRSEILDEPSILPGTAAAELDWDDEEEATSVFDRSEHELFDDLAAKKPAGRDKRDVGKAAAALLASSGKSAKPVKSVAPMASKPPQDSLPRIPAPAPIPRDISQSSAPAAAAEARDRTPSWTPQADPAPQAQGGGGNKFALLLVALAVAGLAVGAYLYLRGSSASPVEISVTKGGKALNSNVQVNIYVDGQKKCEFQPCKLELKPGKKSIRVVSGNLAGAQEVEIKGGKEHSFAIALGEAMEPAPAETVSAAPTTSASAEPTGPAIVKLTTESKEDVKVFVNGKEKGVLKAGKPLELKDLEPGKVKLRFEGDDKYGVVEKEIELKAGETLDVGEIKLPLLKIKSTFELATKEAQVELIKEKDGSKTSSKLVFRGGKAEQTLDTSYTWKLKATAKGYEDLEMPLSFEDDKDEAKFKIELKKKEEAVAAGPEPQPNVTTGGGPAPPPPPPPPPAGKGTINANSIPLSFVIIDGRPRGKTPVTVKVSPGSHTVVFRHKTLGSKTRTVTVGAGQTKVAAVRFKKK